MIVELVADGFREDQAREILAAELGRPFGDRIDLDAEEASS